MKDNLGNRMKKGYENVTRQYLPKRTYSVIRIDGKAFHTLTRHFDKPFDINFMEMMAKTTKYLVDNIQGAMIGYTQSDEISIVLQDFKTINTDAWFDGNIQKIASVSASMATAFFNNELHKLDMAHIVGFACFDSRVFSIPQPQEVINYLIWRNKDCIRNSILNYSQHVLGRKAIHGLNVKQLKEKLLEKNMAWGDLPRAKKYGYFVIPGVKDNNTTFYCVDGIDLCVDYCDMCKKYTWVDGLTMKWKINNPYIVKETVIEAINNVQTD